MLLISQFLLRNPESRSCRLHETKQMCAARACHPGSRTIGTSTNRINLPCGPRQPFGASKIKSVALNCLCWALLFSEQVKKFVEYWLCLYCDRNYKKLIHDQYIPPGGCSLVLAACMSRMQLPRLLATDVDPNGVYELRFVQVRWLECAEPAKWCVYLHKRQQQSNDKLKDKQLQ